MALRNLLVRVGADLSGLQKGMKQAQTQISNFGQKMNKSLNLVNTAMAAVGAAMVLGPAIKDAMEYETAMNQVNRIMGDSADEFKNWAETTGNAFGYSRLEAARAGATYGNLLMTFSKGAEDTRQKTEELMKATAVVSAATGRTMQDTFERIRSGLLGNTEAIEDLGINVNVAMLESTRAFQQFANGQSWDQLSFQIQQQIRLAAILEQAHTKFGDTIADSTSTRLSTFVQSLNNVKLALGQAFLPILNVALPVLSALANRLAVVMGYVAQFMRALVGKKGDIPTQTTALNSQAAAVGGLGDATEKAGKQAKKAGKDAKRGVAGFDQINQLANPSSGGGEAGAGGGGVSVPEQIGDGGPDQGGVFDSISNKVKEFAKNFNKWIAPLGDAWDRLKESISDLWNSPAIKKFRAWVASGWGAGFEGVVLQISGALDILAGAIDIVNAILNGDWKKAWDGVGKILHGFWEIITGTIGPLFPGLTKKMKEFGDNFKKKWDELKNINFAELFLKLLKWFTDLKNQSSQKWDEIKSKAAGVWEDIKNKISSIWESIKSTTSMKANETWNNFKAPFESAYSWFKTNVLDRVASVWNNFKINVSSIAGQAWEALKSPFHGAYSWFKTNVIDKISGAFSSIKDAFSGSITNGFKKVYNTAVGWLNSMIGSINKIKIPGIWSGVNISKIPALAKGGITNGPMLAMIGDNPGGREVVSPLDDLQDIIAGAVGTAVMQANQFSRGSNSGDIILNIDGRTFGRIIKPFIDQENQRIGNNMKLNPI